MTKRSDLIGKRFGRLYVYAFAYIKTQRTYWKCECSCGNEVIVSGNSLLQGNTKSCGCLKLEKMRENGKSTKGRKGGSEESLKKSLSHTNTKLSDAHRKAISDGLTGKKKTEAHKRNLHVPHPSIAGKNNPLYGIHKYGKDNHNYNPNITDEERMIDRNYFEYSQWVIYVYKRDEYTCQKCDDDVGGNLNAHHIESYADNPDKRTVVSNGITLCETCHKDFHHQYGYGNNTKEQLNKFFEWERVP